MSVINQMLKDLEQRSPKSNGNTIQPGNVELAYSPRKIALVTGICVLVCCFISFYVWQLISENNALKAEKISRHATKQVSHQVVTNQVNNSANPAQNSSANQLDKLVTSNNNVYKATMTTEESQQSINRRVEQDNQQVIVPKKADISGPRESGKTSSDNLSENKSQSIAAKPLVNHSSSRVTPAKKAVEIADAHSNSATVSSHRHNVANTVTHERKTNRNKMSVSRRQLSADELVEQKLTLAEKALMAKQVAKAEEFLEEVVIIKPSDSQTRKKLAALWFGRQAYQDAVNLLSQGIALNGKDSSLREMKARIHLKQGQVTAALNTLIPLAQLKDEQYQIMLANTAQQAQQNKVAVEAYKVLITMQPDIGRWYLGLAVLHDKSSQFTLASVAYNQALTKNDLSVASVSFVEQRIQVIGQ
jgi:MSHA biogenesis protein MshN